MTLYLFVNLATSAFGIFELMQELVYVLAQLNSLVMPIVMHNV